MFLETGAWTYIDVFKHVWLNLYWTYIVDGEIFFDDFLVFFVAKWLGEKNQQ